MGKHFRRWLIIKLAGKMAVVLNVRLKERSIIIYCGAGAMIGDVTFIGLDESVGSAIKFEDSGKPINEVLPWPDDLTEMIKDHEVHYETRQQPTAAGRKARKSQRKNGGVA